MLVRTSWPPGAAGRPLRALHGQVPSMKLLSTRASGLRASWRGHGGALDLPPGCWSCGPWRHSSPSFTSRSAVLPLPARLHPATAPTLAPPTAGPRSAPDGLALLIAASLRQPRSVITEGADLTAQPPRPQALGASSGTEGINYIFPSPSFKVGERRQVPGEGAVSRGCGRGAAAGFPWPPPPQNLQASPQRAEGRGAGR